MDKRLILSVAGSGKTTYIRKQLDVEKRHLIITYTRENFRNLKNGIEEKFGYFPENIKLYSFFEFLYSFCYKPFRARLDDPNGIYWDAPAFFTTRIPATNKAHFFTSDNRVYHNRLAKYLMFHSLDERINERIEKYFDQFHIDEIQDFGGYDFDLLMSFSKLNIYLNWVGDFYQHTYDTSRDANKNKPLHFTLEGYVKRFTDVGIEIDQKTLSKSWRCSKSITDFISQNLGINIETHKKENTEVEYIEDQEEIDNIVKNDLIIKLFYQRNYNYNCFSSNWGKLKGADHFRDVCVVLNKTSHALFKKGNLINSAPITKNKLYVACSRANGNLYLIPETSLEKYKIDN